MIIDADGHLFKTEEVFEKYDEGHNFWVMDGQTRYRCPNTPRAFNPGSAAPPGGELAKFRGACVRSQRFKGRRAVQDAQGDDPSKPLHGGCCPRWNTRNVAAAQRRGCR